MLQSIWCWRRSKAYYHAILQNQATILIMPGKRWEGGSRSFRIGPSIEIVGLSRQGNLERSGLRWQRSYLPFDLFHLSLEQSFHPTNCWLTHKQGIPGLLMSKVYPVYSCVSLPGVPGLPTNTETAATAAEDSSSMRGKHWGKGWERQMAGNPLLPLLPSTRPLLGL